ncbi:hypothetical protein TRFO_14207 [Tritrichomonas foetus]|uniref:Nucleoplasmin-like domain-containing protein n=1 Tax=Tritrichomonas foetus TaxID=1144522 RepID=A0A1J4L022_9EUKA|nr:hypothetical protein TRFO_14207 [Tritrichomonas foetus]|eukprot:OHT15302.1 hypothetical protein TRFO_14207 [Tritrichomonas foetus]
MSEEISSGQTPQVPIKYEVSADTPVTIDFTGHENNDVVLLTANLAENQTIEGKATVFVTYTAPKSDNEADGVETKKVELCSFTAEDDEEKDMQFSANKDANVTLSVEGSARIVVEGIFVDFNANEEDDLEGEEEEEEEAKEE